MSDVQGIRPRMDGGRSRWSTSIIIALNTSVGNGVYVAVTGLSANGHQLSRCMWMQGDTAGHSSWENFRRQLGPSNGQNFWGVVNQYSWGLTNTNAGAPVLKIPMGTGGGYAGGVVPNFGMIADLLEPYIAWAPAGQNSVVVALGQLWAAFLTEQAVPMDRVKLAFPIGSTNHDCIDLSDGNRDGRGSPLAAEATKTPWLFKFRRPGRSFTLSTRRRACRASLPA